LRGTEGVRDFESKRTDDDEILRFRSIRTYEILSILKGTKSVCDFESKRTDDGEILSFRQKTREISKPTNCIDGHD